MDFNGDAIKSVDDLVLVDMNDDEVDGDSDSDPTLNETFEILDTEDDFEKKTITKIFNFCRNGEITKLKSLEHRTNKKRFKKWLEQSHDDKES